MKWITHQTGAILASIALGLSMPAVAAASVGAIVPDVIDQKRSALGSTKKARQKIFNKIHRGASHWFGWWLGLCLLAMVWPLPGFCQELAIGLSLGGLSHVGMDMLTPHGVPLLPFVKTTRLAVPVCSTGKASEWLFLAICVAAGVYFLAMPLASFWQAL